MVQGNRQSVEQILAELLEIATKQEGANSDLCHRLATFLLSMWTEDYPPLMEHSKYAINISSMCSFSIRIRRLLDKALSVKSNKGEFLLLRVQISLLEGDAKQALQLSMKAMEMGMNKAEDPSPILCEKHARWQMQNG